MIDNFDKLDNLCNFEHGCYYKFIVLLREKDIPKFQLVDKDRKEQFVRQWLVVDKKYLDKVKPDMITYTEKTGGRLYMLLDKKSYIKTVFKAQEMCMKYLTEVIHNPDQVHAKQLNKLIPSASSKQECSTNKDKRFMLDVDTKDVNIVNELVSKQQEHHLTTLETKNGFHVVFNRKFNPASLEIEKYDDVELKTNCLTLIYR